MKVTHYRENPWDDWITYPTKAVQVTPKLYGPGVFYIHKEKGLLKVCGLKWDDGSEWTYKEGEGITVK